MKISNAFKMLDSFICSNGLLKKTFVSKAVSRVCKRNYCWKGTLPDYECADGAGLVFDDYYKSDYAKSICKNYLEHKYNFLGTGWVSWSDDTGSSDYKKILWKADVITDYRFDAPYMGRDLIASLPQGVDIKRIWEMGRVNHLPFMALVGLNNPRERETIYKEIANQIKDLINTDPVGIGALYYCPMDVGIRCINLLTAYDIINNTDGSDKYIDNALKNSFHKYILDQLIFMINNLEYNFVDKSSGNHFLCDVISILWICAHFSGKRIKRIYKHARDVFLSEIRIQFLENGSNYECSSCYHRLASEMVAIGIMAMCMKEGEITPESDIVRRIAGMIELLKLFKGRDGNIIQIGDNDSGFILKL